MTISVPYLSEEEIEEDAGALLAEYARARGISITPPVPIDDIVEKHLKLSLEFDDTHKLFGVPRNPARGPDILGAIFFDAARIVIDDSLDPDAYPSKEGRYRFTLAHEGGGHWRLHRAYFKTDPGQATLHHGGGPPSVICRTSQAKERVEWQADFYASCLLMPRDLLFAAWREEFGTGAPYIFDPNEHLFSSHPRRWNGPRTVREFLQEALEPDYEACVDAIARRFAPAFLVSPLAMRIRLEQLGLLVRVSRQRILADDA
jgi:hypothetical protein